MIHSATERGGNAVTFWIVLLCIIAFFILLFSIRIVAVLHYEDDVELTVKWLFLKFQIFPEKENKKPKKEKKKKEKKPKEEAADESVKPPKEKKDNILKRFYNNKGFGGVMQLIRDTMSALKGMFGRIIKAFVFDELYISMNVGAGDSAETAIKYGKVCAEVFPAMGFIVANAKVKKYNLEITPDFIKGENSARLHTKISFRPIKITNALVIIAFELLFKVLLKLLWYSRDKAPKAETATNNNK